MNLGARPWTVHTGDCRDALAAMDADSIDACVTDTPYGLSTILDPANLDREALWKKLTAARENRRPLRAYISDGIGRFVDAVGRDPTCYEMLDVVDDALMRRIMEGPAIERLLNTWLETGENPVVKGRGFMGKEWDALVPAPNTWRALWRVMKPGAYLLAFGGARTGALIEMSIRIAGFEIEDSIAWLYGSGFPKRVRLDLAIDTALGMKAQRPTIGPGNRHNSKAASDIYNPQGAGGVPDITGAATPEAARFVGHDRALRPGNEPIIVAEKPRMGTVAANAMRFGTGGLNVDACRIPRGESTQRVNRVPSGYHAGINAGADAGAEYITGDPRGGYPANVILDEEMAQELDRQSGQMKDGTAVKRNTEVGKVTGRIFQLGNTGHDQTFGGKGGASRFFYTAKASTSERDKGLEDLPTLTPGERSGGRGEGSAGINGYAGTRGEDGRNAHPTVKPISLMRYLVRLASPPGAHNPDISKCPVILDIFAGSGSTLVAGLVEGVRVVGCELSPEYADIARRRCHHAYALPPEENEAAPVARLGGQASLF